MIIEWFVDMVLTLVVALVEALPFDATLSLGALSPAFGILGTFNTIFPVTEALQGSAVVLGLMGGLFVYRIVKTLLAHIPLIGGAG